jgi:hypothetical protein
LDDGGALKMADLKLPKLPDRTPVKLTIQIMPDLKAGLDDYAAVYEATYGQAESIVDLIPAMLAAFLAGDRSFLKARAAARGRTPHLRSGS